MKNWKTWVVGSAALVVGAVAATMISGHLSTFVVRLAMLVAFAFLAVIAISLYKNPAKATDQTSTPEQSVVCEPVETPAQEPAPVAQPVIAPVETPVAQQPATVTSTEKKELTLRNITDADLYAIQGNVIDVMSNAKALQKDLCNAAKLLEQKKKVADQFMNLKFDNIDVE